MSDIVGENLVFSRDDFVLCCNPKLTDTILNINVRQEEEETRKGKKEKHLCAAASKISNLVAIEQKNCFFLFLHSFSSNPILQFFLSLVLFCFQPSSFKFII